MQDFVKTVGLEDLIRCHGYDPTGNFETVYSSIQKDGMTALIRELSSSIRRYFEEIRLPDAPTIYDYLILSLRQKDAIISFNWDPLLPQAFQRCRALMRTLPECFFLHGNVDVGLHRQKRRYGFLSDHPTFEPTDLLYPVEQKDYNRDPFIAEQWNRATSLLGDAYLVTVFGYSAPATDVEARSLLLDAWLDNPTYTLAEVEIIDIRDPVDVEASWYDFIYGSHGGILRDIRRSLLYQYPRRTCEAFAFSTLQQDPWHEDPFPETSSFCRLRDWIMPLIHEERSGRLAGDPHHLPPR